MSENTNTPNGDSKIDLYSQNVDTGKIAINFPADFVQLLDPQKESTKSNISSSATSSDNKQGGSNIVANVPVEITSGDIQKVGFVGIPVQPLTKEMRNAIEAKAEKSEELSKYEDKDGNGILDRYE